MTVVEKQGNLFDSDAGVIGHGVNCAGVMGKGIAVAFKEQYPDMYNEYRRLCWDNKLKPGGVFFYAASDRVIANLVSQDKPGPNARYSWAVESIRKAMDYANERHIKAVAIPRIGCGIGGLEWRQMYYELVSNFEDHPVTLEIWSL